MGVISGAGPFLGRFPEEPLMPFLAAAEPGGHRGLMVGIGMGLVGGIEVLDRP